MDSNRRLVAVRFREVHQGPVSPVSLVSVRSMAPALADCSLGAVEAALPKLAVAAVGSGTAETAFPGPHPSAISEGVGRAQVARGGGAAYLISVDITCVADLCALRMKEGHTGGAS